MKYFSVALTIAITSFMVSSVSAVQYSNQEATLPVIEKTYENKEAVLSRANEARNRLEALISNETFLQIKQIVEENFPNDNEQFVSDNVQQFMTEHGLTNGEEDLLIYQILTIIAEAVLLLLGHNLVGETTAMLFTLLLALPGSLILGTEYVLADIVVGGFIILIVYALLQNEIKQMIDDMIGDILYNFGLIFSIVFALMISIIGLILLIIGIPVLLAFEIVCAYFDLTVYMYNYIYGGSSVQSESTQLQMNLNESPSVLTEFLNSINQQTSQILGAAQQSSPTNN